MFWKKDDYLFLGASPGKRTASLKKIIDISKCYCDVSGMEMEKCLP
jgi:hypothetical protein